MTLLTLKGEAKQSVSPLKNPFSKDNLDTITIHFDSYKGYHSSVFKPEWRGSVEFSNGNTKGEQKFKVKGAEGFPELLRQMEEFIKSL